MRIRYIILLAAGSALVVGSFAFSRTIYFTDLPRKFASSISNTPPTVAAIVSSSFKHFLERQGTIDETQSMGTSADPYWWVGSGGAMLIVGEGTGSTLQGELGSLAKWRLAYSTSNPIDTDNGYHPQNIFRLVTRSVWENASTEAYFVIEEDNLSESPNRNASNGLLFFIRYKDEDNLYYTGVRVDGAAVIKKKVRGTYYTMAYEPLVTGEPYDRHGNPNLLPKGEPIGMKSEVETQEDGSVKILLFTDLTGNGEWTLATEAIDDGSSYGGAPFYGEGHTGIRTDFMDVSFMDFTVHDLARIE
jgi:hypothetical protein